MNHNTIVLLGMAASSLVEWDKKDKSQYPEIWGLAHDDRTFEECTRAFESHSWEIIQKHSPSSGHLHRLMATAERMPLYTPWEWPKRLGQFHYERYHEDFNYISTSCESSIAYMMLHAIDRHMTGPESYSADENIPPRIEIYGVNMSGDEEYVYQRANMAYLIGKAEGMGIEVYLPPESGLLTKSQWKGGLYGSPLDVDTIKYGLEPNTFKHSWRNPPWPNYP